MSELARLDINHFGSDGTLIKRVSCLGGFVTVFRGRPEMSDLYLAALLGRPQTERFSILLNDSGFNQKSDSLFLDDGELRYEQNQTCAEYLGSLGVSSPEAEPLLLRVGLGGRSTELLSRLSKQELYVLKVLNATLSDTKVLVLDHAFRQLPENMADSLASFLTNFATQSKRIVLVFNLSMRPQCWLENVYVNRVELSRIRQSTIGFGSSTIDLSELRKEMAASNATPTLSPQIASGYLPHWTPKVWSAFGVVFFVCLTALIMMPTGPQSIPLSVGSESPNPIVQHVTSSPIPISVLDAYPEAISVAVTSAFEQPDEILERVRSHESDSPGDAITKPVMVEAVTVSAFDPPPDVSSANPGPIEDIEARREEIRRRFLTAISQEAQPQG